MMVGILSLFRFYVNSLFFIWAITSGPGVRFNTLPPVVVLLDVIDFEMKSKFPGKVGMLRRKVNCMAKVAIRPFFPTSILFLREKAIYAFSSKDTLISEAFVDRGKTTFYQPKFSVLPSINFIKIPKVYIEFYRRY